MKQNYPKELLLSKIRVVMRTLNIKNIKKISIQEGIEETSELIASQLINLIDEFAQVLRGTT